MLGPRPREEVPRLGVTLRSHFFARLLQEQCEQGAKGQLPSGREDGLGGGEGWLGQKGVGRRWRD